jgi:hypothetical protein
MRVLVIPDLQCPFEHKDALRFLKAVSKKYKTQQVVCIGDEADFHAISDYDHDPDGMSAGDELKKALKHLGQFYKAFPKVRVCTSNHTARPFRKAFRFGLPSAFLRSYSEFLQAPKGWVWSESFVIDGVRFEHGEGYSGQQGALKAAQANGKSTVIGHIHAHAGIQYSATPEQLYFGMNVGCLINRHAYAFAYGKYSVSKPILGCGVLIDGVPHFVPMLLNKKHRWVGKL